MERLQVKAQTRDTKGKGAARKTRVSGLIPGIVYGVGMDPINLNINHHDFDKVLKGAESLSVLIDLEIDGKETLSVMLRDYQVDVIKRDFLHVDFHKIDLSKKLRVEVPIHLVGSPPGVKEGGILEHTRRVLEVKCLPTAIPDFIDVDVSHLNIGDSIHASEINYPEGVESVQTTDITIAAVVEPAAEKPEEVAEEEGITEPEVLTEKKPAEGEEAGKEEKKEKKE